MYLLPVSQCLMILVDLPVMSGPVLMLYLHIFLDDLIHSDGVSHHQEMPTLLSADLDLYFQYLVR